MPPSRADQIAETLTRQAARRRAVDVLTIASSVAGYAARSIGNGLPPEQARRATLDVAAELEQIAGQLRKLTRTDRLDPAGRRALAADLAASDLSHRKIAARLGVDKRTIWADLRRSRPGLLAEVASAEVG